MKIRSLLFLCVVLGLVSVAFLAGVRMMFPNHWRVVAAEQLVLSPWLDADYLGDGGPAEELLLCYPKGLARLPAGDLLISDRGRERRGRVVWRIDRQGIAHLFAGNGLLGAATESRADELQLNRPEGLAVARDGSVFLADGYNHAVLHIATDGSVTRYAGNGVSGFSGDGGPAAQAQLYRPGELRVDGAGNLYIADVRNHRVRKVDIAGVITTVAGTGEQGFSPDGTPARDSSMDTPWAIGLDDRDRLLIAESANHVIRRVEDDGTITTVAGTGRQGYSGDGGPATDADLNYPEAVFSAADGRLFIADAWNNLVRVVNTDGTISTVAGTGEPGRASLGEVAANSPLDDPGNVLSDVDGFMYSDGDNGRIVRVTNDGLVELVAGRGEPDRCTEL